VVAPVILLNRQKQTLVAQAEGAQNPVRTVLVSDAPLKTASGSAAGVPASGNTVSGKAVSGKTVSGKTVSGKAVSGKAGAKAGPSIIRLRSGDLRYSEGERLATLHGGVLGNVTAETAGSSGVSTIVSDQAEVLLLPAGVHVAGKSAGPAGSTANTSLTSTALTNTSIDRLTALGHVQVDWPDRRGTGEKLVYQGEDATFTLTGTSAAPPRITDQERGTVTGSALIFHSRDDSVTVEGDGGKTVTETHARK
jgi:lipopolysaccharide export system protein LptA